MEIIENFFSKSDQDLVIKARTPLNSKKFQGKYENLIAELVKELDNVPNTIGVHYEKSLICGIYTLEAEVVLSGRSKYQIESNSLTIPKKNVKFSNPSTSSLIFSVNNPKWGYSKNLLAELVEKGVPEIMVEILLNLSWTDLRNLYKGNSVVLLFLQKSRLSSKFWDDYWKENYGLISPENPWKTLVQMNGEISLVGKTAKDERERTIYIKYNATEKYPLSYYNEKHITTAFEYDSLEIFEMISSKLRKPFLEDEFKRQIRRGIGPKCLNYILEQHPEKTKEIIKIACANTLHYAYHKEIILYMLNHYQPKADISKLGKILHHLAIGETRLFFQRFFGWSRPFGPNQFNMLVLDPDNAFAIYLDDLLFLFAIPEYYECIEKTLRSKELSIDDIYRNSEFSKWLIINRNYEVSSDYFPENPILTRRVVRVLEETNTKEVFSRKIFEK